MSAAAFWLLGLAGGASAANSFSRQAHPPRESRGGSGRAIEGTATITQSTNAATVVAGSVSCNNGAAGGFEHADNDYARSFDLSAFPALNQPSFAVQSVTIGIETANDGGGTGQPVTLRLAEGDGNPAAELPPGGTLLSTDNLNILDQTLSLQVLNVAAPPTLTVATDDLVVDIFTPNGQTPNHVFFIGSNALGQSGPSFIASAPCGLANFADLATIGFANMHIVMSVSGDVVPVELQTFSIQ
jgi:hypothetical protein